MLIRYLYVIVVICVHSIRTYPSFTPFKLIDANNNTNYPIGSNYQGND